MRIPSKAVHRGLNADMSAWKDDRYVRCWNCGFVAHLDREGNERIGSQSGDGYARNSTQLNGAITAAGTTATVDSTTGFPTPATGSITAFENNGRGTKVTSAAHGLTGGKVVITSTTNYDGTFYIQDVLANSFVIPGKAYVADDATGTWTVPEYIYIFDAGAYATSEDADSTWTDATNAPRVDKVSYTGITSTTFTGCVSVGRGTGMYAHDDDMYVKQNKVSTGCPLCGCKHFDSKEG